VKGIPDDKQGNTFQAQGLRPAGSVPSPGPDDTAVAALTTTPVATAVGFLPSLRAYNQYATLASIHAATVVISGGADPLTPPSHALDLTNGICRAQHVHVPYAGHMLPQQAPHVINDAIRRIIASPHAISPCWLDRLG
jgi:pimeloyl-ACP methyl ester carboxylesterase